MSKKKNRKKHSCQPWEVSGVTNRHHDLAQCRGGTWSPRNIYTWDKREHEAFHFLFGNLTLLEVAAWLIYIDELKQANPECTPEIKIDLACVDNNLEIIHRRCNMLDSKKIDKLPITDDDITDEAFEARYLRREQEHLILNQLAHKLGYTSIRSLMYENGLDWDE